MALRARRTRAGGHGRAGIAAPAVEPVHTGGRDGGSLRGHESILSTQLAVMAQEFRDEVYLARLPPAVQRALASVLAPLGRLLSYEAINPRFEH